MEYNNMQELAKYITARYSEDYQAVVVVEDAQVGVFYPQEDYKGGVYGRKLPIELFLERFIPEEHVLMIPLSDIPNIGRQVVMHSPSPLERCLVYHAPPDPRLN